MVLRFTYTGYDDTTYAMQRLPGRFDFRNRSFLDRHIAYVLRNPLLKLQAKERRSLPTYFLPLPIFFTWLGDSN